MRPRVASCASTNPASKQAQRHCVLTLNTLGAMFTECPKCGHYPLPANQALPVACPACGVIFAKVAQVINDEADGARAQAHRRRSVNAEFETDSKPTADNLLLNTSAHVDPFTFWPRVALWVGFAIWGVMLIAQDYRTGELGSSFIHRPLLVFHEAGHVVFRLFGQWMMVLGGTLGQLIMPAIFAAALLIKQP